MVAKANLPISTVGIFGCWRAALTDGPCPHSPSGVRLRSASVSRGASFRAQCSTLPTCATPISRIPICGATFRTTRLAYADLDTANLAPLPLAGGLSKPVDFGEADLLNVRRFRQPPVKTAA